MNESRDIDYVYREPLRRRGLFNLNSHFEVVSLSQTVVESENN